MLEAFAKAASRESIRALHDPMLPIPFANLELKSDGSRQTKKHGIAGAKARRNAENPSAAAAATTGPLNPQTPARSADGGGRGSSASGRTDLEEARLHTQPVTEADISHGQIRIPKTTKRILPAVRCRIRLLIDDARFDGVRWDPRSGPDRERSGVIGVGKNHLRGRVTPWQRLTVSISEDGTVVLRT